MKNSCSDTSDRDLRDVLFKREDDLASSEVASHVESCENCQTRLIEMVDGESVESEAGKLLSGYVESYRELASIATAKHETEPSVDADLDQVWLEPPSHPEMLGRIGRYEIERRIGSGGMGVVFKAIDTELNRPVAVKVLVPHLARNGAARQRFARESRAAAAVVHEHVVSIHNVDSNAKYPYLVMQYVAGESLQTRVEREGSLDVECILRIGIQAALGLAAAHQQGVVHRDIKPANILLEEGVDRLLITDFGLARTVDDASLTHTGVVAGTPNYMSPEQANGDEVDHRSDLFSLGSVLYFAATGHPPFRAERAMGVLHRICRERHRPVWHMNSAVSDDLSKVIDRLLEKRPVKRFANASAVACSLTSLLQQLQNRRPRPMARMRSLLRRHQLLSSVAFTVLIAAAGLTAWPWLNPWSEQSPMRSSASNWPARFYPVSESNPLDSFATGQADTALQSPNAYQPIDRPSSGTGALDSVAGDRADFDQALESMKASLSRIEQAGATRDSDSAATFRQELNSIEQALQTIDPAIQ